MLKVNMIRHGKTYGNSRGRYIGTTDEPLLPEEAEALRRYAFEETDQVFASPLTVSYTHLDVYKRQEGWKRL